jgi:hypothetical protein
VRDKNKVLRVSEDIHTAVKCAACERKMSLESYVETALMSFRWDEVMKPNLKPKPKKAK